MFGLGTKERQLADLEARVRKLERQLAEVVVDWEGWYDKYRQLYGRISKRARDAEKAAQSPEPSPVEVPGAPPHIVNPLAARLLMHGGNGDVLPDR